MTPLLYAIKMKSVDCVDVLVLQEADPSLSIKIQEKNGEKSLNTSALDYAVGEKKKAASQTDKEIYEDIIQILKSKFRFDPEANGGDPAGVLSPSQTADVHRVAQRTIQNQLAIKKLTEENEILKKELLHLKNEIERFRPWIERWIFESAPASVPSSPSNLPIIEEVVPHAKKNIDADKKKTYI